MWIYDDLERTRRVRDAGAGVRDALDAAAATPLGLAAHAGLVTALVAAGELVQGLADRDLATAGRDRPGPHQEAGGRLLATLGAAVVASMDAGLAGADVDRPAVDDALAVLCAAGGAIRVRKAEGFAFYALYPEAHAAAALASGLGPGTRVVGLRSIGCPLAGVVAAALGAAPPVFVRPVGDPFRRRIEADPALLRGLADDGSPVAVVDEGPGLSGSSFAAAADWLEAGGVAAERIRFFPGHAGPPGAEATPGTQDLFRRTRTHHVDVDRLWFPQAAGRPSLRDRVEDLVGPLVGPLEDLSGGAWRRLVFPDGIGVAAADPARERRKWLARTADGAFLVRFAGLGDDAERKLSAARCLAAEGWVPEPVGLVHGMLVERWVDGRRPDPSAAADRTALLARAGRYLGRRTRLLAAPGGRASLERLAAMAVRNAGLALGADAADRIRRRVAGAAALEGAVRPAWIDGRLQAVEWVIGADGRAVKTDHLDHAASHDLVGAQDVAWDVAGAILALDLSPLEAARLAADVEAASGRSVDPRLVDVLLPCHAAFQVGLWSTALPAGEGDADRLAEAAGAWRRRLAALAGLAPPADPAGERIGVVAAYKERGDDAAAPPGPRPEGAVTC